MALSWEDIKSNHKDATKYLNTMNTNSEHKLDGGFSFRRDIIGKPNPEDLHYLSLGRGWQWAPKADAESLMTCLTRHGWAVTPGQWQGGHKSKNEGTLIQAEFILLDFDQNLSWKECQKDEYLSKRALFAYTTASHQAPGKGDRFRVAFQSDLLITDPKSMDLLIKGLRMKVPGSDPAINSSSLLYGNPKSEVHVFDLSNRLPAQELIFAAAVSDELRRTRFSRTNFHDQPYDIQQSERRVRRWLEQIPNTAYSIWITVAGCLRAVEASSQPWAFEAFDEWSAREYAAYDPSEVDRLWESFDNANPGGFSKLKHLAEWFKANPGLDEYQSEALFSHSRPDTSPNKTQTTNRKRTHRDETHLSFSERNL